MALRAALFCTLGLVLITPFLVTPGTIFPFVVGKALWSRALIEIAFALWAGLALARSGYRPPRSWLLWLLGAGLCASLLSAWSGISFQRSFWSNYERMQGVLDQAHWVALAVVLASVLRTPREWRTLLAANVAAGGAMACLVIARSLDVEVPFYGRFPEANLPRLGGPAGNPVFLAVYMLSNLVLACGFAVRAWTLAPAPEDAAGGRRRLEAVAWAVVAALNFAGLVLAGSVGGFAGLLAAAGFAALAFAWLARGRRRFAALALLAALAAGTGGLGYRFLDVQRTTTVSAPLSVLGHSDVARSMRYMGGVHLRRPSVQSRLEAWAAGLEGFAARPWLGWGPENFGAVFGRYAKNYAATAEPHDQAHGKVFEVAATTGVVGLAAWLATWGLALTVLLRAARNAAGPERSFGVFTAAALAGYLVQIQFLFDIAVGNLLATILVALAARLEPAVLPRPLAATDARTSRGAPRSAPPPPRRARHPGRRRDRAVAVVARGEPRHPGRRRRAQRRAAPAFVERHPPRDLRLSPACQPLPSAALLSARPRLAPIAFPRSGPCRIAPARSRPGGRRGDAGPSLRTGVSSMPSCGSTLPSPPPTGSTRRRR